MKIFHSFFSKYSIVTDSCAQAFLTLCWTLGCSPPLFPGHVIFQARILEWAAIFYSRRSSWPRDQNCVSCISCTGRQNLDHCATWSPIFVYTFHNFFMHSSIDGHWGCFHILAIEKNATVNTELNISFQISVFIFFEWIPRIEIAGLYGIPIFNFLRNPHTVYPRGSTSLHFHQHCMRISFLHIFSLTLVMCVLFDSGHYFLKISFYWSNLDSQCCVSFCLQKSEEDIQIHIFTLF